MKRALKIFATVVLLLLVVVLSSPWWFNFNGLRGPIASAVSSATGRDLSIGHIKLDMGWTPTLTIDNIQLANADWTEQPDMLRVKQFLVSIRLKELLHFRVSLPELIITTPEINLAKNADGEANWVFGEPAEAKPASSRTQIPLISHMQIKDGRVVYNDATRNFNFVANIQNFKGNAGGDEPIRANATGQLQGEPFTLKLEAGSFAALENEDKPYPLDVDVRVGQTHAALKGTADQPLALRALSMNLRVEGPNLAALYPVLSVPLPATPPYKLSGLLQHEGAVWRFKDFDGKVGDSDLAGDFNVDIGGERMKIIADLTSKNLDFDDLGPSIGVAPDASETASAEQATEAVAEATSNKAIPDTTIDLTKLRTADAEVKLKAKRIKTPDLPIDDMDLDLSLENGLLRLQPLQFGVAGGTLNAYATIDASVPTIRWDYDVRLRDFRLAKLLKSASLKDAGSGNLSGDIKLKSRGNTLHDTLAMSNGRVTMVVAGGQFSNLLLELAGVDIAEALGFLVTEDKKVPIRCIVADLDVKEGVVNSRELVIDTTDTRIDGDLKANLKDETFDLKITPEPKDPSLFSVRTPVSVSGTFKDIGITPDYKSLGLRAGVATALGLLATPAAAVLAFIEPGLGEDAQCEGLLESTDTELPDTGNQKPQE